MTNRLWAKSWNERENGSPPPHVFLPRHLRDVLEAADEVLDITGDHQLRAFGLEPAVWQARFRRVVRFAAATHDLGKANDHFQGMVTKKKERDGKPQGLRHEWVTWLLLQDDFLGSWLKPAVGTDAERVDDWTVMLWAVTGHHPAYGRASPPTEVPSGKNSEITLCSGHVDFHDCLCWLAKEFLGDAANIPHWSDTTIHLRDALDRIGNAMTVDSLNWTKQRNDRRFHAMTGFVAAAKNCLVAADVAGSAIPEIANASQTSRDWIRRSFAAYPSKQDVDEIVADRLTVNGTVQQLRPFQCAVAEQAGDVTLVKAGCGSGKTLAAYHWLRTRHPGRRLFLCYPTTGTATEGFRDYVFDESARSAKFGARLFHGRADVDVKLILRVKDRADESDDDALARIESLDTWSTPIVVCTVDTVLGVMQNNRRGLYAWPALAGAAFVFDEIHAFDSDLFGALLRFIRELRGVPILLMTASLPESRLKRLRDTASRRGSSLVEIGGPEELETLRRYHRGSEVVGDSLVELVAREWQRTDRPGKVLWVCNTVNRAMDAATHCAEAGLRPLIYHSRFRYEDRLRQHGCVIDSFKNPDEPSLAICTQVAEMSLDLSATLLVTDLAPISALIQRLGRLNRRAESADDRTMPFVVLIPTNDAGEMSSLPYSDEELAQAKSWLAALSDAISQRDLVQTWESLPDTNHREKITTECTWLDGGPRREVKELRKGTPGITVILEQDLPDLRSTDPTIRKRLAEVLLPMPRPPFTNWRDWPEYQGIKIAPKNCVQYERNCGGRWRQFP